MQTTSAKRSICIVSLLVVFAGCTTPWADRSSTKLPTIGATPTGEIPRVSQEPLDPNLDVDTDLDVKIEEVSPANELGSDLSPSQSILEASTETVVRGQNPAAFGYAPPPGNTSTSGPAVEGTSQVAQYEPNSGFNGGNNYPTYGPGPGPVSNPTPGGYDSFAPGGGYGAAPGRAYGAMPVVEGYGPAYSTYDGSGIPQSYGAAPEGLLQPLPADYADLVVNLQETQTGRFMFGVGVNSDLGLTAQATIDERNFDWRRWPRKLSDIGNGTAWRGGGQALRIEAVPGTQVQRYLINFTQPYLFDTLPISFNLSAFLFDRRYTDWDEQRFGGRVGLGYRITPDLSLSVSLRGEQVDMHDPRVRGIPIIESALGESDLFSGRVALTHDTRDLPFAPTEGHYLELSYEQVFGSFQYPRANVDYRRYYLLKERVDRSGRHTLGFSFRGGITGSDTPVYENFFAGGYSTMRGFRFRHASPKIQGVGVGGQLSLLGSVEYIFPITADDMLRGALFCDYGTVEETYERIDAEDFRIALGAGLRINVPAMGPAPIALDFAVPIAREDTDRIQNFSFFVALAASLLVW